MYKTKRELAQGRSRAATGWHLALLPSFSLEEGDGATGRACRSPEPHCHPYSPPRPPASENLRYVPWRFPLTECWGLALKSRKCWKIREGLQVVKFSFTQKKKKKFKLRKHTAGKQKERQKISITFNFDFLDQRSQSFCFIICFVSS